MFIREREMNELFVPSSSNFVSNILAETSVNNNSVNYQVNESYGQQQQQQHQGITSHVAYNIENYCYKQPDVESASQYYVTPGYTPDSVYMPINHASTPYTYTPISQYVETAALDCSTDESDEDKSETIYPWMKRAHGIISISISLF